MYNQYKGDVRLVTKNGIIVSVGSTYSGLVFGIGHIGGCLGRHHLEGVQQHHKGKIQKNAFIIMIINIIFIRSVNIKWDTTAAIQIIIIKYYYYYYYYYYS